MQISRRSLMSGTALALAGHRFAPDGWSAPAAGIPVMARTDFSQQIDPAYLSNGLIGIRPGPNPLAAAATAVSGYVYAHPVHRVECLSPAPYPLATDVVIGDASFLKQPERVTTRRQTLDMATGELLTEMDFEPKPGMHIAISVVQFACRSTPALLCQEITIASDTPVSLKLLPQIVTQDIPGQTLSRALPQGTREADAVLLVESGGHLSQIGIALAVMIDPAFRREGESLAYVAEAGPGRQLKLRTIAAMVSSFYHSSPDLQAIRMASWGRTLGFDRLRQHNREAWASLWKSRVRIDADADSQRVLDAAFFYLHSSVHVANQNGMPPFGLSQAEHYFGHSFWDTETWSLLPILLAAPDAAKSLLEFRLRGLEAARRNASLYGYSGAQFPWEAAQTDGSEVTPVFAATGWSEQHVVPDVALAVWQYQMATGDPEFLRNATWPVLKAVAEWIGSRGEFTARGYEIRNIMGPNEDVNNIDNNAYANVACSAALEAAVRCAGQVGHAPPKAWKRMASALVLPRDPKTGAVVAYDGSSQDAFADLSFLLPFEPTLPAGALERTYAAFKQRRREYMIGFATAGVAAGAASQGDRKLAADLFEQSWRPFWMPPYGMVKEDKSQTYGCFLTDFGAMLQAVLIGFTGLRIQDGDWAKYSATLPGGWTSIEVDRIWVRGEPKRLLAVHGRKPQLTAA
jgi:trehalose/maltose hydrolase-like predicted phosphorylase